MGMMDYFKLLRVKASALHSPDKKVAGHNKYLPHQGVQEKARRARNFAPTAKE
jgi:hypothetical protein